MTEKISTTVEKEEFVITRTFNASRELMWKALTEPEHLAHWWGPKGFKMLQSKVDLRPGGLFHYGMEGPGGFVMWGRFVYREIVAPEKMVFVVSFSDEAGNITRAPMSNTWPLEVLNILTLTEQDGKTTLRIEGGPINTTEEEMNTFHSNHASMQQGFKGTYDQLEEYLSTII